MQRLRRVVLVLIALVVALLGLSFASTRTDKHYNSHLAAFQSEQLLWRCETYYRHPDSGKQYPPRLTDLVNPPFRDFFPEVRESDLLDPWGNPFKYAIVKNAQGGTELYVWAERVIKGQLKLLGAKMSAGGKVEAFGVPE